MSKFTYTVVAIRKGREKDYREFWINNKKVNTNGEELHSNLVGFTELVKAKNEREAGLLIKEKYPDLSIDYESIERLG